MSHLKEHWLNTKKIAKAIDPKKIAEWLLTEGYFPEQYVFPPTFHSRKFKLKDHPYCMGKIKNNYRKIFPDCYESTNISYPKTQLTERVYGIYHPQHYHDIVWYIHKQWNQIINFLFDERNLVYSYSFPIPINKNSIGNLGELRSGRMIYEYIELAEKDLLSESYKFKFLLKTDIKNFYPSIYTHSISWAIHTKKKIRNGNENNFRYLGNILDRLLQFSNDRKTNGIPIGPAISDLIAELILTAVDKSLSKLLNKENIIAARYKDDYFFLIDKEDQADGILRKLQICLKEYNLSLNEEKTKINTLPEGLFRTWIQEFDKYWKVLKTKESGLSYTSFFHLAQETFKLHKEYPNTGIVDKFISKLTNRKENYSFNVNLSYVKDVKKGIMRIIGILIHLSKNSKKSFPACLGVIQSILNSDKINKEIKDGVIEELESINNEIIMSEDEHMKLWWTFFILSDSRLKTKIEIRKIYDFNSDLLRSFKVEKQRFYKEFTDCELFSMNSEDLKIPISKHLDTFSKDDEAEELPF